jgi:hypothetical protein
MVGCREYGNKPSASIESWDPFWLAIPLLASSELLCVSIAEIFVNI